MQQAAINLRHENFQFSSDLYTLPGKEETSFEGNKYFSYEINSVKSLSSLNDWEFFCNELEYE